MSIYLKLVTVFVFGSLLLTACAGNRNDSTMPTAVNPNGVTADSKNSSSAPPVEGQQKAVLRAAVFGESKPFLNISKACRT